MTQWDGKAKGTPLGYKIFIFCIKNLGLTTAYSVLVFVAGYYLMFSFSTTRTSYIFYRRRLNYSFFNSISSVYKNYFVFGQTLIDRMAISFGMKDKFVFTHDGRDKLRSVINGGEGGVIFSAHIGSFNIARFFFDDLGVDGAGINLMVTDQENEQIKQYVGATSTDTSLKFIVIKEDMSHIFQMNEVLINGEVIIFAADRYVEGVQFMEHDLFGKSAKFPSGPYKLAARRKKPILFMYIMKGSGKKYHLYAREPKFHDASIKPSNVLSEYVRNMEIMVKKYPLQWFNYYDYWEDIKT